MRARAARRRAAERQRRLSRIIALVVLELALAADRSYMLDDTERSVHIAVGPLNESRFPKANGLSRLATRFLGDPEALVKALASDGLGRLMGASAALEPPPRTRARPIANMRRMGCSLSFG